jgi:hypothetical protein
MNIRKIIKEEMESADFDWIKEIKPYDTGKLFDAEDVCFNSGTNCKVNINYKDSQIIYVINYNQFQDDVELHEEDSWYLEPFFRWGSEYYDDGDYYEFDSEEFNYAGYELNDNTKLRLQQMFNRLGSDVDVNDYTRGEFSGLEEFLKYPYLVKYWYELHDRYLETIGYIVQKNRWLSTGSFYQSQLDKHGLDFHLSGSEIIVTVPFSNLERYHDLSETLIKSVKPIIEDYFWSDLFYDDFDTSGAEDDIQEMVNLFINKVNDFLDEVDEDDVSELNDLVNEMESLGFSLSMSRRNAVFYKQVRFENQPTTQKDWIWVVSLPPLDEFLTHLNVELKLYQAKSIYYGLINPKSKQVVPYTKVGEIVNNYRIEL